MPGTFVDTGRISLNAIGARDVRIEDSYDNPLHNRAACLLRSTDLRDRAAAIAMIRV